MRFPCARWATGALLEPREGERAAVWGEGADLRPDSERDVVGLISDVTRGFLVRPA